MPVASSVRELAWDSLLSADLNQRYFAKLGDMHRHRDRWGKFVVAAFGSGSALAGWALWEQTGLEWMWPVLTGVAAVVAIALPIFDPAKTLKSSSTLAGAWFGIFKEYELLWAQIDKLDEPEVVKRLTKSVDEEKRLSEIESGLSKDRRLAREAESEVRGFYEALAFRNGG